MATTQDLEKGKIIKHKGGLYTVIERAHHKPGKGVTVVRTKLKSLSTGSVLEHTFKSGENVEFPSVDRKKMQYLYTDGTGSHFMDMETYEQAQIDSDKMDGKEKYLRESEVINVLYHEGRVVTIDLPIKVTLKVVTAPPAVKGNTASGNVTKLIKLETGLEMNAPMFIKEGESIVVNTEKGEYVERA